MKEIFEQYGGTIVTVIAIFALVVIIKLVIGTNAQDSIVYDGFHDLLENFYTNAHA